jgi:hypothetical protein
MPTKNILRSETREVNATTALADERRCMRRADTYNAAYDHDDVIVEMHDARMPAHGSRHAPPALFSRARRRHARVIPQMRTAAHAHAGGVDGHRWGLVRSATQGL